MTIAINPEFIAKLNQLKALAEQALESGVKHPLVLQGLAYRLAEGVIELTDGRLGEEARPAEPLQILRQEHHIDSARQDLYAGAGAVADLYD